MSLSSLSSLCILAAILQDIIPISTTITTYLCQVHPLSYSLFIIIFFPLSLSLSLSLSFNPQNDTRERSFGKITLKSLTTKNQRKTEQYQPSLCPPSFSISFHPLSYSFPFKNTLTHLYLSL